LKTYGVLAGFDHSFDAYRAMSLWQYQPPAISGEVYAGGLSRVMKMGEWNA
jgi:hypothetical protein